MSHAINARVIALAKEAHAVFHPLVNDGKNVVRDGVRVMVYDRANAPPWLPDLCQDAHDGGDILPDDWRYSFIVEALFTVGNLEAWDSFGDAAADFAEADVYNSDRLAWLASRLTRAGYCDEAIMDGLCPEVDGVETTLLDAIGAGQARERADVFGAVLSFLLTLAEAQVDEEAEESDDGEGDDQ